MLDIRFVRENPDAVKENIRKKFQDAKLPLVDEVIALDAEYRAAIGEASDLRANRNKLSKQIGALMGQAKKDPSKAAEAEEIKKQVTAQADRLKELEAKETELQAKIQEIMYTIPQMSGLRFVLASMYPAALTYSPSCSATANCGTPPRPA